MLRLHARICGEYVGRFEKASEMDQPVFIFDANAPVDLSISIQRGKPPATPKSVKIFLDALVPENPVQRLELQRFVNAKSDSSWDLLEAIGGDLAGGISLSVDENFRESGEPFLSLATEEDIATRIQAIKRNQNQYTAVNVPARFSLAGAQSKFALNRTMIGATNTYFWPDHSTPSTHILKPEAAHYAGLELIETATLRLANLAGVDAARATQAKFLEVTSFMVERFDRRQNSDGTVTRIHAEDLLQALGEQTDKYLVDASEVIELLRTNTGDNALGYEFLRQLVFNTVIGNADAHAKNYTILHQQTGFEIAPLYDAIPLSLFPNYLTSDGILQALDQSMAMPLDGINMFQGLTGKEWIVVAKESGLDVDRVLQIVYEVSTGILEHLDKTLGLVDHPRVGAENLTPIRRSAERHMHFSITPPR